jgi:hypothetical protein
MFSRQVSKTTVFSISVFNQHKMLFLKFLNFKFYYFKLILDFNLRNKHKDIRKIKLLNVTCTRVIVLVNILILKRH